MYKKDKQVTHWLEWFGNGDNPPFPLEDGRSAATDGRTAVACRDDVKTQELPEKKKKRATVIATLLDPGFGEVVGQATLKRAVLAELCGECEHTIDEDCGECGGDGLCRHCENGECPACDGDGTQESYPDIRYGSLWGKPFNLNLIAYLLAHSPSDEDIAVRVAMDKGRKDDATYLIVSCPSWQAVIVSLESKSLREHHCKEIMASEVSP